MFVRRFATSTFNNMRIVPVPVRTDNYAYLLIDDESSLASVVDPYDVNKVSEAATQEKVQLGPNILTTHHHADHAGGNIDYIEHYKSINANENVNVYGGVDARNGDKKIPGLNSIVKHGDTFSLGKNITVKCLATPCHTQDSISYFVQDEAKNQRAVFTGDTLFIGGCGRFFEGTASEMVKALHDTLGSLPDDTLVYCGHEYTKANAAFGEHVSEDPHIKKLRKYAEENGVTTGKFTIGDEKKHNVFMTSDPTEMARLRAGKNNFRA